MKQSERGEYLVIITRYSLNDTYELNCAAWQVPEEEEDRIPRILLRWLKVNMGLVCPVQRSEPVRMEDREVWDWIARHFGHTREFNLRIIWPQQVLALPECDDDLRLSEDDKPMPEEWYAQGDFW